MADDLGFSSIVDDILQEFAAISAAEDGSILQTDLKNKIGQPLQNWFGRFTAAYNALKNKIDSRRRIQVLRQVNNVYYAEDGVYDDLYLAQEKILYNNAITVMVEGYRLLNGIREALTGTTITYKVVAYNKIDGKEVAVEYNLTEDQLLEMSTPTLLGRISASNKQGTDLFALQLQFSKSLAELNDIAIKDISEDSLYQDVMDFEGHHHLGRRMTLAKSRLLEVYYQGAAIGLEFVPDKSYFGYGSRFVHGMYEVSLRNTPYWQGGDVLEMQIKSTETFDLTKSTSLHNQLSTLIKLFTSPNIDRGALEAGLMKVFFERDKPLKTASTQAVESAMKKADELTERELANFQNFIIKLKI